MQNVNCRLHIFIFFMFISFQASAEGHGVVQGVYQNDLTIYTKEGKRRDDLADKFKDVSDDEIKGIPVLERTPRNLVKIHFRDEDVWIRSSQLRLSMKELLDCPESTPVDKYDRHTPISSGVGPECNKKQQ